MRVYDELVLEGVGGECGGVALSEITFDVLTDDLDPVFVEVVVAGEEGAVVSAETADVAVHERGEF